MPECWNSLGCPTTVGEVSKLTIEMPKLQIFSTIYINKWMRDSIIAPDDYQFD